MVVKIPLSKRGKYAGLYEALIDDCDSDLAELRWSARASGNFVYVVRGKKLAKWSYSQQSLHVVVLERVLGRSLVSGEYVDHINRDTLDNRRDNLRIATNAQNLWNRVARKGSKSGLKGVSWIGKKKLWKASIRHNGKSIYLGSSKDKYIAYQLYCDAANRLHGNFANTGEIE